MSFLRHDAPQTEAEDFFKAFVSAGPARLAWFATEVRERGGPALDGSVASLGPLWAWMRTVGLRESPAAGELPVWADGEIVAGWGYDGETLRLLDGLIHYVAAVYRRELGVGWELKTDDPGHAFHQAPVLTGMGGAAPPWRQVMAVVNRHRKGKGADDQLQMLVAAAIAAGPSAPVEMPLSVEVLAEGDDSAFDYHVSIPEWTEDRIGAAAFATLGERFAAIPGVQQVVWEDREVFLVDASLDAATLEAALLAVLDAAAG